MNIREALFGILTLMLIPAGDVMAAEIYAGEPLDEALYDLVGKSGSVLIAHELSNASTISRIDVFRLKDGRLVGITSSTTKMGESYSIKELRITPSSNSKLTKQLPTVSAITLSDT